MVERESFQDELKRRRKALDLTQAELAREVGCSIYTLQHIEVGSARPSRQLAQLLAARLAVPAEEHAAFVQRARAVGRTNALGQTQANLSAELTNPYKGLQAFQEADAPDFFGRETLTQRLGERLREDAELARFLAVVGPSGAGKSSVVRAGLLPALRQGTHAPLVADLVPGTHPFEELEAALLRAAPNPPPSLLEQLQSDERGLVRVAKRLLPADCELVLLIDQFEELFTLTADEAVRAAFIASLYSAVADARSQLRVIITLRADFYDRPFLYLPASELFSRRTEAIGALAPDELHQAIVAPAERHGLELEAGLAAAIVHDVADQPGALPLMQYALSELYERRDGRRMTLAAYQASGGVRGALARRAEHVYTGLNVAEQIEARNLFLRLVTPGESAADTRRRVSLSELLSATHDQTVLQAVLDRYVRYRMLTFDREPRTGETTVEVAHEALIHSWGRFDGWLAEGREQLLLHRRLLASAGEWQRSGQETSFLANGTRLAQFAVLANQDDPDSTVALTAEEQAYIAASLAEQQRAETTERDQQARELSLQRQSARRLRTLAIGLVVFLLVASGLAMWAFNRSQVAQTNFAHADALRLAADSNSLLLAQGDNSLIALLALRSLQIEYTPAGDAALTGASALDFAPQIFQGDTKDLVDVKFSHDGKYLATSAMSLHEVLLWDVATGKLLKTLGGYPDLVTKLAFSPDDSELLTGSFDGTPRLWNVHTGQLIRSLSGHSGWVVGVAFAPSGRFIATGGSDGSARIWDRASGAELQRLAVAEGEQKVVFSPDSSTLLTGGGDNVLHLWDVATGRQIRAFSGPSGTIRAIAFSPDGRYVAGGSDDKTIGIWDAASGQELHILSGHKFGITSLAFSPDSRYLISGSGDFLAKLWDVATGQLVHTFSGHTNEVDDLAFAPDGRSIVTSSDDGSARIWSLQHAGGPVPYLGHTGAVHEVAFSPDGKIVLTASDDDSAKMWDAASGEERNRLIGHTDDVWSAVFAPDGRTILTASADTTARLWDASTSQELRRFTGHTAVVRRAAFVPGGRRIVTASEDGTARVWDVASGKELARFSGHSGPVLSAVFAPDGNTVVTAGEDGTARIWDAATGEELRVLRGHAAAVTDVAISPDGKLVATSSSDGTARLWDGATGKEVRQFLGHTGAVFAVTFSSDGGELLTGANDQTARVWNVQTGAEVRRLTTQAVEVSDAAFSPDGTHILTSGGDGSVRLWPTDYHDTIRYLCGALTRDLTADERTQYGIADDGPTCGMYIK